MSDNDDCALFRREGNFSARFHSSESLPSFPCLPVQVGWRKQVSRPIYKRASPAKSTKQSQVSTGPSCYLLCAQVSQSIKMLVFYFIALVLVAQTQSAALPETETPIETVIVETKENKEAKASVDTVDFALLEYTEKDREKDVDSYLDTAVQADKFGCGSRLICELHRRAESELLPEEVLLRSMFDGKPLAVSSDGPKVSKGRGVFQYAAFIGSTAKNSETCSRAFSRCPFDSDTILIVFRAIGSSPALKSLSHPFPSHKLQPPKATGSS